MYTTDLSTLLKLLQKVRQDGRVRAQIPQDVLGSQGGYAFIDMLQGNVVSCSIVNLQGQIVLSGNEALRVISTVGALQWEARLESQTTNPNLPAYRSSVSGSGFTNPNLPAYQPDRQTNPNLPAYRPDGQTNPNLPAYRPNGQTNPHFPAYQAGTASTQPIPAIQANVTGNPSYQQSGAQTTFKRIVYPFSHFIPAHSINIDAYLLSRFPRRQKRVLILVDGVRTIEKIASILMPGNDGQQEIYTIVRELIEMQVIHIKGSLR
ncbi:hypothetical protein [Dictyobacter arantiisoli]|uniref:hypothetical protein n=1 Tax=Dictyobacter arantiisoli TaxID=2014874 RepID=UPI0011ED5494|nr:hypothetical protein [Dictyobacter arantiisoli]